MCVVRTILSWDVCVNVVIGCFASRRSSNLSRWLRGYFRHSRERCKSESHGGSRVSYWFGPRRTHDAASTRQAYCEFEARREVRFQLLSIPGHVVADGAAYPQSKRLLRCVFCVFVFFYFLVYSFRYVAIFGKCPVTYKFSGHSDKSTNAICGFRRGDIFGKRLVAYGFSERSDKSQRDFDKNPQTTCTLHSTRDPMFTGLFNVSSSSINFMGWLLDFPGRHFALHF